MGMPQAPGMPPTTPTPQGSVDPTTGQPVPVKLKPDEWMRQLDYRMYNLQQQLTALLNAQNVKVDPGVLVTPPGAPMPPPEAAMPGGPQAPTPQADQGPAPIEGISGIEGSPQAQMPPKAASDEDDFNIGRAWGAAEPTVQDSAYATLAMLRRRRQRQSAAAT